jgi:excisionase family DNA binding protein
MGRSSRSEWLTPNEVAQELKLPPEAVDDLIGRGTLPAIDLGGERRVRVAALERHLRRSERGGRSLASRLGLAGAFVAALVVAVVASGASGPYPGERVPRQIPYRGVLELNGLAAPTEQVEMVFALYTTESGGAPAWTEAQSVAVQDGQFTVALGDTSAINPALFAQPSLYLGISVKGTELTGRQRLLTVPYTHRAQEVDSVPPGAVMFFNLTTCPGGWAEVTSARGRAMVGMPAGGTLGGTIGSPLGNLEDRPHSHWIEHAHGFDSWTEQTHITGSTGRNAFGYNDTGCFVTDTNADEVTGQNHNHHYSGSTGGASRQWADNNFTSNVMPYFQLLVCQKQ